jgi:TetR/AcrR family transcriptional regulator, mexJK operon transcriptional repressor
MARRGRPRKDLDNGGKRTEVLEVASKFFLAHGYDGASINAMARASGISKESIYRYFVGKEELFKAVIEQELALYQQRLDDTTNLETHVDLESALVDTAEHMLTTVMSDRTLALRRLIFQEATQSPDIGALYHKIGPSVAYQRLETLLSHFGVSPAKRANQLARHFAAMLLHAYGLERECGLRPAPSPRAARTYSQMIVADFMRAFLPEIKG